MFTPAAICGVYTYPDGLAEADAQFAEYQRGEK
jgi:hypothetical protein